MEKILENKIWLILLGFVVLFVLVFVLMINSPAKFLTEARGGGVSLVWDDYEMGVYFDRVSFFYNDGVPYEYTRAEYPALGMLYLTIPAFFDDTLQGYQNALIIQNLIFALILIYLTYRLINILGRSNNLLWLFMLPSFLYFLINRFDIFPAVLIQLAILFLLKDKFTWAFIVLGLSFLAKGYAIVLFPVFLIYYLVKKDVKIINVFKNKPLYLMVLPTAGVLLILMIWAGIESALFPYIFQSSRSFGYGSIYAIFISANWDYFSIGFWKWYMAIGSKILGLMQLALPLVIYAGYDKFKQFIQTKTDLINWSLLVLLLYIQLSPYYSPQWFVWVLPLFILLNLKRKEIIVLVIYDLLNFMFFPLVYGYFGYDHYIFDIVVFIRSIVFVWLLFIIVKKTHLSQIKKIIA